MAHIAVDHPQQIEPLGFVDRDILGGAVERDVGGADQAKIALVRIDENHPLIVVLQEIGLFSLPEFAGDDMAALHQPHVFARLASGDPVEDALDPRAGGIHQRAAAHRLGLAVRAAQLHLPKLVHALGGNRLRARAHHSAMRCRVQRVENHQPRIIDPAIGIFESGAERVPHWLAFRRVAQIELARPRQALASTEMIIEEQPQADHPGRPLLRAVRQHEAQRPDDVRCRLQQHLTFDQRFAHQAELMMFEIAQPAMHQLTGA